MQPKPPNPELKSGIRVQENRKRICPRCICPQKSPPPRLLGAHRAPFRDASLAFHSMSIPEVSSLTPFSSRLPVPPLIRVKYLTPADRDRWGGEAGAAPPPRSARVIYGILAQTCARAHLHVIIHHWMAAHA